MLITEQHKASIIKKLTAQAHYVVPLISLHEKTCESTQTLAKKNKKNTVLQPKTKVFKRNSIAQCI